MAKTLVQRIALEGGDDIKRELLSLGKAGEEAFRALSRQAEASKVATVGLNKDLVNLRARFNDVSAAARKFGSNFSFLSGAVGSFAAAVGAGFSAQAFINITSSWTDLNSRLKLATGSSEEASVAMTRLGEIADRTYSSFEATATVFADNSIILNALGLSTEKQLDLQEALNNSLVISGARGDKARRIQEAFTKAMGLGALRGDELNAVLQVGGKVAQLLADELGVPVNALRALGEQGLITAEVFQNALLNNMEELRKQAEEMPATIADGFIRVQNALFRFIGTADEASGVSSAIAGFLVAIAENIGPVITGVLALAGAFAVVKGIQLARDLYGVITALLAMVPAIAKVTLAFATNPFGLAALAVTAIVTALIVASGGMDNFLAAVQRVAKAVLDALWPLVEPVVAFMKSIGDAIKALAIYLGLTAPEEAAKAEEAIAKVDEVTKGAAASLGQYGAEGKKAAEAISGGMSSVETSVGQANTAIQNLDRTFDNLIWTMNGGIERAKELFSALQSVGGSSGSFQTLSGGGADSIQALAGGGPVRGAGTGTSDSILARLSNGEFVMKAKAVRKWGVGFLSRLNHGLPAFAEGGMVSPRLLPSPDLQGLTGGSAGRPLSLTIGGETFDGLMAPDAVADKLVRFATGRAVRRSGLTPSWYK